MVHQFLWVFRSFSGTDRLLILLAVFIVMAAFASMTAQIVRSGQGRWKEWFQGLLQRTAENIEAWNLSVHEDIEKMPSAYEDWADDGRWRITRMNRRKKMTELDNRLGKLIRDLGYTQNYIINNTEIYVSDLSHYCTGKSNPSLSTLIKILRVIHPTPNQLYELIFGEKYKEV